MGISCVLNSFTMNLSPRVHTKFTETETPHCVFYHQETFIMDLMLFFELDCVDCTLVYYEDCRRRKHREWEHNLWTMDRNQQKMIQH